MPVRRVFTTSRFSICMSIKCLSMAVGAPLKLEAFWISSGGQICMSVSHRLQQGVEHTCLHTVVGVRKDSDLLCDLVGHLKSHPGMSSARR